MLPISPGSSILVAKPPPLLRPPALVGKPFAAASAPRRPRFLAPLLIMWNTYNALLTRYPLPTEMITAGLLWMSGDVVAQRLEHRLDPAAAAAAAAAAAVAGKEGILHLSGDDDTVENNNDDVDNDNDDNDDATTAFSTSSSSDISSSQTVLSGGNAMEIELPSSNNGPVGVVVAEATSITTTSARSSTRTPLLDWKRTRIQMLYAALLWGPAGHYWYEWLDGAAQSMASLGTARFVGIKLLLEIVLLHPVALTAFFVCVGLMGNEKFRDIIEQLRSDFWPSLMLEYMLWIPCDIAMFAFIPVRHQLLVVNTICLIESVMLSYIKSNGISLPGHGGDSGEGKKKDRYRQVNGAEDDEMSKQSQDVFVDQDITSEPKPRLLPSIKQRMRGWRRRKSAHHLQEMSPREARPLHEA